MAEFIIMLIILGIVLTIFLFLAWYFVNRAKVKDKQFLIEKGISVNDPVIRNSFSFSWLKIGIICIGISLAMFSILILDRYIPMGSIHVYAVLFLFVGISMIVVNFIGRSNTGTNG